MTTASIAWERNGETQFGMDWGQYGQSAEHSQQGDQTPQQPGLDLMPPQSADDGTPGATGEGTQQQSFSLPQQSDPFPFHLDRDWHDNGLSLLDNFPGGPGAAGPSR